MEPTFDQDQNSYGRKCTRLGTQLQITINAWGLLSLSDCTEIAKDGRLQGASWISKIGRKDIAERVSAREGEKIANEKIAGA